MALWCLGFHLLSVQIIEIATEMADDDTDSAVNFTGNAYIGVHPLSNASQVNTTYTGELYRSNEYLASLVECYRNHVINNST